jgi:hypothetical protein
METNQICVLPTSLRLHNATIALQLEMIAILALQKSKEQHDITQI